LFQRLGTSDCQAASPRLPAASKSYILVMGLQISRAWVAYGESLTAAATLETVQHRSGVARRRNECPIIKEYCRWMAEDGCGGYIKESKMWISECRTGKSSSHGKDRRKLFISVGFPEKSSSLQDQLSVGGGRRFTTLTNSSTQSSWCELPPLWARFQGSPWRRSCREQPRKFAMRAR
jgi:hypothetical protein